MLWFYLARLIAALIGVWVVAYGYVTVDNWQFWPVCVLMWVLALINPREPTND